MATIDPKIADPAVSPYTWEAIRDGGVFAVEFPGGGDAPETSFASIGFTTRLRGEAGREVPTFVNATGEVVRMKARSLREATCPMLEIDIAPGDAVIWAARPVHVVVAGAAAEGRTFSYQTLLFGRETVAGEVTIAQIWPTGEVAGFDSYAAAMTAP